MNMIGFIPGMQGGSELLLLIILSILLGIFWIWSIVDCASKESSEGNEKIIWVLIIILLGWLGSLLYCIARRPKRIKALGK